jgi:hypothetical protein
MKVAAEHLAFKNAGIPIVSVDPASIPRHQEDPFADCLWARLETESINPSLAKIITTISLGTAEISPVRLGGRVRLGLTRIKLRLNAESGEIPYENRWPQHEIETFIHVKQTEECRQQQETSSKSGITAKLGAKRRPTHQFAA